MRHSLRSDLLYIVPPQIPAWGVAEMRQERVDTGLHDRFADRVLDLIPVIHGGVITTDFYLLDRPAPEARPEVVSDVRQGCQTQESEAHPPSDSSDSSHAISLSDYSEKDEGKRPFVGTAGIVFRWSSSGG